MEIEITKMTSKGQVVIPQDIRIRKKMIDGEKFIVYDSDDSIILKRVSNLEKAKDTRELEKAFSSMWAVAKSRGVGEKDVQIEIESYRKSKNKK